jgi:hypothetical protein
MCKRIDGSKAWRSRGEKPVQRGRKLDGKASDRQKNSETFLIPNYLLTIISLAHVAHHFTSTIREAEIPRCTGSSSAFVGTSIFGQDVNRS